MFVNPAQDLPLFRDRGVPTYNRDLTISERFEVFHHENPHVYRELVRLARNLLSQGVTRYSVRGLFAVLRYFEHIRTSGDDFALNDHYTPLYARMIMEREPDLKDFFEVRERVAK